ncbi:MAG: hypothetical protein Q9183_001128 [Haloplaca sp. 2 TL-2023]
MFPLLVEVTPGSATGMLVDVKPDVTLALSAETASAGLDSDMASLPVGVGVAAGGARVEYDDMTADVLKYVTLEQSDNSRLHDVVTMVAVHVSPTYARGSVLSVLGPTSCLVSPGPVVPQDAMVDTYKVLKHTLKSF